MWEIGNVIGITSTFQWEINVDCFERTNPGDFLYSPTFFSISSDGSRNEWKLKLVPKHQTKDSKVYLSLYLIGYTEFKNPVTFSFSLINRNNVKDNTDTVIKVANYLFKKEFGHGCQNFFEQNYVMDPKNNIVKDNTLTIECNIMILKKGSAEMKKDAENKKMYERLEFLNDYEKLMTNNKFSDVTITAEGKKFCLHKNILSAHSSVFDAMFTVDMREKNESKVEIKDINSDVLEEVFRFIYSGKVSDIKSKNIVCELLTAAEKYCIEELKALCTNSMCNNLTIETATEYLVSARMNNAEELKTCVEEFICSHLGELVEKSDFREFSIKNPEVYFELTTKYFNLKN